MAKGEAKRTNEMIQSEQTRSKAQQGGFYNSLMAQRGGAQEFANKARGETYGGYQNFAATGGLSDEEWAKLANNPQMKADWNTARGMFAGAGNVNLSRDPNLTELAGTGGWNPEQIARYRRQNAEVGKNILGANREMMRRGTAVQGYNPGYVGQQAKMMREGAQSAQVQDRASQIQMQAEINGVRLTASQALQMANNEEARLRTQGTIAGAQGLAGLGSMEQSSALDAAKMKQYGQLAGLGGMAGMYTAQPGELMGVNQQALSSQGLQAGTQGDLISQWRANNPNIPWWQKFATIAGAGAGLAKGLGGLGIGGGPSSGGGSSSTSGGDWGEGYGGWAGSDWMNLPEGSDMGGGWSRGGTYPGIGEEGYGGEGLPSGLEGMGGMPWTGGGGPDDWWNSFYGAGQGAY